MASRGVQLAGRYALIEPIGTGRLAVVWRAWDSRRDRTVAVKVIRPHYGADGALRRRILAAAKRAAKLDHLNVVRIDDAGTSGELLFVVTELVDGPTLAEVVGRTQLLPPIFALELGASVASALALAHRRRVVHGDISPTDIFLGRDGRVRVADFGLATAAGLTPLALVRATPADDVAALGALVFRLVRGRPPGDAGPGIAPGDDGDAADAPSLGHYLPAAVNELLVRVTSDEPGIAFGSAAELGDELAAAAAGLRAGLEQPEAEHETQVALAAARPALLATHPAVRDPPEVAPATPVRRRRSRAAAAPPPPAAVAEWVPVTGPPDGDPQPEAGRGTFAEPLRRDRRRRALAGAALAMLLVAVGAAPSLTRTPRGGVLGATSSPPAVAARPSPRSTVIFPTPLRTPVATPSPSPTATATPPPPPPPTPPPTPPPAPATPRPTAAPPRLSPPSAAVANFYDAVEEHDWDRAIAAWSPGMRERYPVDGYLIGRFRPTTDIDVTGLRLITIDETAGTATVAVSLVEYRSVEPSPRTFVGDWDLILVDGRWLLHDPDF